MKKHEMIFGKCPYCCQFIEIDAKGDDCPICGNYIKRSDFILRKRKAYSDRTNASIKEAV